jgi:hypothetical protein
MLISGAWLVCADGVIRPVIRGDIRSGDGSWVQTPFLVDTAADRTVFSASTLKALGLQPLATPHQLGGVGGVVTSVLVETQIQFPREDGVQVVFRGQYAALTEPEALDMSVLGRDITNLFAVITDRPRDFVCLLGQRHQYVIVER